MTHGSSERSFRSSLRAALIPVTVSIALSIVIAIVFKNPVSLLYGLAMPVLALVPVIERLGDRRRSSRERAQQAREDLIRTPSPAQLLRLIGRSERVPEWAHARSTTDPPTHMLRIGVSLDGTQLICLDAQGGVELVGPPELCEAVHRALRASTAWLNAEGGDPILSTGSGARWQLCIAPDLRAIVRDRWGLESTRNECLVDVMTEAEAESFATLIDSYHVTTERSQIDWDLVTHGPHALVSGVTGSGKTVFLRTWLSTLIRRDDLIAIVIIDFKGGGGFADFAPESRVRHVVSNLEPDQVHVALSGISILVEERQRVLADYGALDIDAVPASVRPPRVVIVVDEFRALIEAFPHSLTLVADIAARGRALGLHLILATQRFTGVAPPALTSNCSLRIAFHSGDADESRLMLGDARAADTRLAPGRGFVCRPGHALYPVRCEPTPPQEPELGPKHPLWLEPLRPNPPWSQVANDSTTPVLGLADDHRLLMRTPVSLDSTPHLLIIQGGNHGDRRALVLALAEQLGVDAVMGDITRTWAALGEHEPPLDVVAYDFDAAQNAVPPAWREEFLELMLNRCRQVLARGKYVVISFSVGSGVPARFRQLEHHTVDVPSTGSRAVLDGNTTFTPVAPTSTPVKTATGASSGAGHAPLAFEHTDIIVTSFVHRWADGVARVVTSEDWIFGRVNPAPSSRIFVDGLTPGEAKALRINSECVPPPVPGTIVEAHSSGRWVRHSLPDVASLNGQVDARRA